MERYSIRKSSFPLRWLALLAALASCHSTSPETGDEDYPGSKEREPLGLYCSDIYDRFVACSLISEGVVSCDEPESEESFCLDDCILDADCDTLTDYYCSDEYQASSFQSCMDGCLAHYFFVCADLESSIFAEWICDGESDCQDGSDELGCPDFTCESGEVIPERWVCDYAEDCSDGSDEVGCPGFVCDSEETLPEIWRCDGEEDCDDGSDELGCDMFECGSGELIVDGWVCDYVEDCLDGSDEDGCPGFRCASGEIVPEWWECDFTADCMDGSDEHEECSMFLCDG